MKKIIISLFIISSVFFCADIAFASERTKNITEDSIIIEPELIFQSGDYEVRKRNKQYAVYNLKKQEYTVPYIINNVKTLDSDGKELKLKSNNSTGYLNTDTNQKFFTECNDIELLGKYLLMFKSGKYGVLNKSGKVILSPSYQKISVINKDSKTYFAALQNSKYRLYNENGKALAEKTFNKIAGLYALANDINPQLVNKENNIPVAHYNEQTKITKSEEIEIGKKKFLLITEKNKAGISDINGKTIIPVEYNNIKTTKILKKHYVIAAVKGGKESTIFDLNGKILAFGNKKEVNIMSYGKTYTYTFKPDTNIWELTQKDRTIGFLTINGGEYEFLKTSFHPLSLNKVNELLLTVLSSI